MKRRELAAGCLSLLGIGVVGASEAAELPPTDGRPSRLDDAGSASTPSDGGTLEADANDSDASESATLEVLSTASGETDVRLRLVRARDETVVHDRVRTFEYGERAHLTGRCAPGETYAFSLSVAGAKLVQETVRPGERVAFELLDETTVSHVA